MDLLTTVRKEGSRGGRGDFKWSDVQSSSHRENYLGHSLMAPVGRWQTGRDLGWYAKGDANEDGDGGESPAEKAARERREEIKRIKEAEQDALARALGYDVPPRNPNLASLGDRKEVDKLVKDSVEDGDAESGRGLGFGKGGAAFQGDPDERIEGDGRDARVGGGLEASRKHRSEDRRNRSRDRRHRSRSRSGDRDRERRRRERHQDDYRRRARSMSREHTRRRRSRSRSRRHHDRGDRERRDRRSYRSRSPYYNGRDSRGDNFDKRRP